MARQTSAIGTPGCAAAMPWSIACTTSAYFSASSADASPTTTVRQICASCPRHARRDLGEDDVALLEFAAGRGLHRAIVRPGAEQQEIVLGAERLHVPLQLDRELVLAHAGLGDVEQVAVAELGDARRLARMGDLVVGLGAGGVEHELVGGRRARAGRRRRAPRWTRAGSACRRGRRSCARRCRARRRARRRCRRAPTTRACGQLRPARSASHAGVDDQRRRAVAAQDRRRGPERLEAGETVTGFGFSMKCAPSCSATMASSFASRMRARMSARRSLKVMRSHVASERASAAVSNTAALARMPRRSGEA